MLIHNSRAFIRGLLLLGTFVIVFCVFFMEVFPSTQPDKKITGLVYADHLFNTLSKGSSNFFDSTARNPDSIEYRIKNIEGKQINVAVPFKETQMEQMKLAAVLAPQAGLEVLVNGNELQVKGDLRKFLGVVIDDSLTMYNNKAEDVAARYGLPADQGRFAMKAWWQLLNNMVKPLQKQLLIDESNAVNIVQTKGVEASYNFYGIEPLKVRDNIPLVAGFLIFYVVYTMWYGFAIFEIFEGIGLTMTKSAKKEV